MQNLLLYTNAIMLLLDKIAAHKCRHTNVTTMCQECVYIWPKSIILHSPQTPKIIACCDRSLKNIYIHTRVHKCYGFSLSLLWFFPLSPWNSSRDLTPRHQRFRSCVQPQVEKRQQVEQNTSNGNVSRRKKKGMNGHEMKPKAKCGFPFSWGGILFGSCVLLL